MLTREIAGGAIRSLLFSPDGETLIASSADGTRLSYQGPFLEVGPDFPRGSISTYSPTGQYLLRDARNNVFIKDLTDPLAKERVWQTPGPVTGIAFVGRDRAVVGFGELGTERHYPAAMMLLNLQTGLAQRLPMECRNGIRAIVGFPDRRLLIWVTDHKWLFVQDITRPPSKPHPLKKDVRAIALSPDGKTLAVTADWDVLLFDVERWPSTPRIIGRHTGMVTCLAFTPDGRSLLTGGWDETVRTWDLQGTRPPTVFNWPVGRVSSIAVAPDGLRAVVGGETGTISIWDLDD